MNINNFFLQQLKTSNLKFTIIIGSGFHSQFLVELNQKDEKFNMLKNWRCLIDSLKNNKKKFKSSNNFLIDFENLIIQIDESENKQGVEIEKDLTKELSEKLTLVSSMVKDNFNKDILKILNANFISDVINLNFDTILEEKYSLNENLKFNKKTKTNYKKDGELFSSIYSKPNFRYRELNGIKFWHPHGDIHHPNSLILSTRKYGSQLAIVESLRKHYKKDEKKNGYDNRLEFSWFDAIMNRPLLILGAGLSSNEQDILFAISSKKRNYLNHPNKDYPIFQMLKPGEVSNIGDWAKPISNLKDYTGQWEQLFKLFSKHEK